MKLTKNTKLDVAYVQLKRGKVFKTIKIKKGILVDLDKAGNVLGIEVLSLQGLAPHLKIAKKAA